jgi:hypothetical protein
LAFAFRVFAAGALAFVSAVRFGADSPDGFAFTVRVFAAGALALTAGLFRSALVVLLFALEGAVLDTRFAAGEAGPDFRFSAI